MHAASCVRLGEESSSQHGPAYDPGQKYAGLVRDGLDGYVDGSFHYGSFLGRHIWNGDYFHYFVTRGFGSPYYVTDKAGLPKVHYDPVPGVYDGGEEYNPVTIAQFGLMEHSKLLATHYPLARDAMLLAADWLVAHQEPNGSFVYGFPYKHHVYDRPYKPGWTSALAQGQALSLFARAWSATRDPAYLDAGEKALRFLLTPAAKGGPMFTLAALDPSLAHYVTFEEYPIAPPDTKPSYTVNGMMHVLIGLYDWSFVNSPSSSTARIYFECGAASLKKMVPYAELGGFSSYDLGHIVEKRDPVMNSAYQAVHIYMLFTLFDLTKDLFFERWALKWAVQVNPDLSLYRAWLAKITD